MNGVTLVSMFYDIGRESWGLYPRKVDEYLTAFEKFIEYNFNMVVFVDDRYIDKLYPKIQNTNIKLFPINFNWMLDNIWAFSKIEKEKEIMNSSEYQSLVADRIKRNYPENVNPLYTILTHSKIDFVNFAIDYCLVDTETVAWVDFGYFYNKTSPEFLPNSNQLDLTKFDLDKINLCLINPLDDKDLDIRYTTLVAPEKIGAYFFLGNRSKLKEFQDLCHLLLNWYQDNNLADDEQALWIQCYNQLPELFKLHVFGAWHRVLKEYT